MTSVCIKIKKYRFLSLVSVAPEDYCIKCLQTVTDAIHVHLSDKTPATCINNFHYCSLIGKYFNITRKYITVHVFS